MSRFKVFKSGQLNLVVNYNDRTDQYKVKLCPSAKGERCETQYVGAPKSGSRSVHGKRLAVDDPRAFKQAASAAISFASSGIQDYASGNRRGTGWFVRPTRKQKRRK